MKLDFLDTSNRERILQFLNVVDKDFAPALSSRVDLGKYADKLAGDATNLFAVADGLDIAHAAFYCNDEQSKVAYLSSIGVLPRFQRSGVAGRLLEECLRRCFAKDMRRIELEVNAENKKAIRFYKKHGFRFVSDTIMQRSCCKPKPDPSAPPQS
ncbi:MAG: hypothetical protein Cons2KO_10410 [Congregibacter sp.]